MLGEKDEIISGGCSNQGGWMWGASESRCYSPQKSQQQKLRQKQINDVTGMADTEGTGIL